MKNLAGILIVILLFMSGSAHAATPDENFEKGKLAYQQESYVEAFHFFTNAAEAGHADAQLWLGSMYQTDEFGLKEDWVKVYEWYEKAAQNGSAAAALRIAQRESLFVMDFGDNSKAIALYERAAENGSPDAMDWLARVHNAKQDHHADKEKEVYWTQRAAAAGNKESQLRLSQMYFSGYGVERDVEQGGQWLQVSAANGNPKAQASYGAALFQGALGEANKEEGLEWVKLAARNENPAAFGFLGMVYLNGDTVAKDPDIAFSLFVEAVKLRDGAAAFKLAEIFAAGGFGEVDVETALTWLEIAEFFEHPEVARARNVMQRMFVYESDWVENAKVRAEVCRYYKFESDTCRISNVSTSAFIAEKRSLQMFNETQTDLFGSGN